MSFFFYFYLLIKNIFLYLPCQKHFYSLKTKSYEKIHDDDGDGSMLPNRKCTR